ncbi:MobF family relaxase [Dendronalium sp. ChiSLP03b]|uniref:MobF family relaxase n=1 Tax=Dendronalium sp. ChiSLP03b TaxID=3075381 RepID=UPI002AD45CFB|nr:MobF family relaxase [Dendronalium sp. ChiSLP03b]MDZ8208637.1 MobF family relaxase [Dendronalium sp. ChiSLP03b]
MLTAKNISSSTAVEYFLKGPQQKGESRWHGRGAEKLKLVGTIDDERAFSHVANGRSPDGTEQLNAKTLDPSKRRAALDCTFSAPKSVSLIGLVSDRRLIESHQKSVSKVLNLIEQVFTQTRVREFGKQKRVATDNLIVATFNHIESREQDPHLHSHCLIMNATQAPNGKWQSLCNDEIFANKKSIGMAYQNFLSMEVEGLGYKIEHKQHSQFEIQGFTDRDLKEFSKRRQQILQITGAESSLWQREKAWSITRQRKKEVSPEELIQRWQQQAQLLRINFAQSLVLVPQPANREDIELEETISQEVDQLDDEQLCALVEYVADYFEQEPDEQAQTQKMKILRKVLKDGKTCTLERLTLATEARQQAAHNKFRL